METWNKYPIRLRPLTEHSKHVFKDALQRIPFNFWVSGGTALGLYRDDDLIPTDTDIDFAALGYKGIDNDLLSAMDGYDYVLSRYKKYPMQMVFIKDDTIVDFYFHYQLGNDYVNFGSEHDQKVPAEMYDNIKSIKTKYGDVPVPEQIERYLEERYGDWKTPRSEKPAFVREGTHIRNI